METMERDARTEWVRWLESYDAGDFYDAFLRDCQGAESRCVQCDEAIYLDIVEGGGIADWHADGDYGCWNSPDTTDDGTGGHRPAKYGE